MITLTYHEVAEVASSMLPPGIIITPEQFSAQLDHMLRYHVPTNAEEIVSAIRADSLPENSFCVTFDDGFRGQHDVVLSILEARGIQGNFFVPTCLVHDRVLPVVERQRLLQYSNGSYEDFYARFANGIREHFASLDEKTYIPTSENLEGALSYYAEYRFYSPMERLYRKVRETMLPGTVFETIVDGMFQEAFDEEHLVDTHFLSWGDLRRMKERGHIVGGHGHRHLLESNVDSGEAVDDHRHCLDLLEGALGEPVLTYAYPYGIYIPETVDVLRNAGIQLAFTCHAGRHHQGEALLVDRYDCKVFPFDAASEPIAESQAERDRS